MEKSVSTEDDFRLSGVANCYGTGTRSYNRSAEKREMDRQRKAATEQYLHQEILISPICRCRSFEFPHELKRHKELASEYDWRLPGERYGNW